MIITIITGAICFAVGVGVGIGAVFLYFHIVSTIEKSIEG